MFNKIKETYVLDAAQLVVNELLTSQGRLGPSAGCKRSVRFVVVLKWLGQHHEELKLSSIASEWDMLDWVLTWIDLIWKIQIFAKNVKFQKQ